jgi:hypothetical protein
MMSFPIPSLLMKLRTSLGWALLAAVASLPLATASQSTNGVYSGDDETIGTLPMLDGEGSILIVRDQVTTRPTLYLEGRYDEVLAVLLQSTGRGVMSVQALGADRVRCHFHGRLALGLDLGLLAMTDIQVGVHLPGQVGVAGLDLSLFAPARLQAMQWGRYQVQSWNADGLWMLAQN